MQYTRSIRTTPYLVYFTIVTVLSYGTKMMNRGEARPSNYSTSIFIAEFFRMLSRTPDKINKVLSVRGDKVKRVKIEEERSSI